jgi:hypothetical protein
MPPRFVYWTILIDGKPTAFRARDQQDLLPTVGQLKRTNRDVVMKWFARGKLWDSPEAERAAGRPALTGERRGSDWRPGGAHKDPRDRFKKRNRPERAWSDKESPTRRDRDKLGPPADREHRPFAPRPAGGDRKPWSGKPQGPRKPWGATPGGRPKPWGAKPAGPRKPWHGKPRTGGSGQGFSPVRPRKPWPQDRRATGKPRDDEPDKK